MSFSSTGFPLFPTHDPVTGYFLGKMMQPSEENQQPMVMMHGTVDGSEFTLTSLWNEDGLEIEGGVAGKGREADYLSNLDPKIFIDPTGGFWGAAKEMQVRSVMQVQESLGHEELTGTHAGSILADDATSEVTKMETKLQGNGTRIENALTLSRDKKLVAFSDEYMLVPSKGEVSLSAESAEDGTKVETPKPLSLAFDQDGSWRMSGELVRHGKDEANGGGTAQGMEAKEPVSGIYRLMKMPFIGVPYVQVDTQIGQAGAHYFIAPLPALLQLSAIVSKIMSQSAGKPVLVHPSEALEQAKKLQRFRVSPVVGLSFPVSPVRPFMELRKGAQKPAFGKKG